MGPPCLRCSLASIFLTTSFTGEYTKPHWSASFASGDTLIAIFVQTTKSRDDIEAIVVAAVIAVVP